MKGFMGLLSVRWYINALTATAIRRAPKNSIRAYKAAWWRFVSRLPRARAPCQLVKIPLKVAGSTIRRGQWPTRVLSSALVRTSPRISLIADKYIWNRRYIALRPNVENEIYPRTKYLFERIRQSDKDLGANSNHHPSRIQGRYGTWVAFGPRPIHHTVAGPRKL
jgi:hypothetical protein